MFHWSVSTDWNVFSPEGLLCYVGFLTTETQTASCSKDPKWNASAILAVNVWDVCWCLLSHGGMARLFPKEFYRKLLKRNVWSKMGVYMQTSVRIWYNVLTNEVRIFMISFVFSFLTESRLPKLSTGDLQMLRQVVLRVNRWTPGQTAVKKITLIYVYYIIDIGQISTICFGHL